MESDIAAVYKSKEYYDVGKYFISFFEEITKLESNNSFKMSVTPLESEVIKNKLVADIRLNGEMLIESGFTKDEIYDGKLDNEIFNYLCYQKAKVNSIKYDESDAIIFKSKKEAKESQKILQKITRLINLASIIGIGDFKLKE